MTFFFPNSETGNKLALNGDFSGYTTYRLELISNYNNKEVTPYAGSTNKWVLKLDLVESNERYTEFNVTYQFPVPVGGNFDGFYTYNLWGTESVVSPNTDFDPNNWTVLNSGLCKVLTTGVLSSKIDAYEYVGTNDNAESYVIYNQS